MYGVGGGWGGGAQRHRIPAMPHRQLPGHMQQPHPPAARSPQGTGTQVGTRHPQWRWTQAWPCMHCGPPPTPRPLGTTWRSGPPCRQWRRRWGRPWTCRRCSSSPRGTRQSRCPGRAWRTGSQGCRAGMRRGRGCRCAGRRCQMDTARGQQSPGCSSDPPVIGNMQESIGKSHEKNNLMHHWVEQGECHMASA